MSMASRMPGMAATSVGAAVGGGDGSGVGGAEGEGVEGENGVTS
jgi:hypothetical protein